MNYFDFGSYFTSYASTRNLIMNDIKTIFTSFKCLIGN